MSQAGWIFWPLGVDSVGNPVEDASLLGALVGSQLVEWKVVEGGDVYVRRLQD